MRTLKQASQPQAATFSLFKTEQSAVFLPSSLPASPLPEDIVQCTTLLQKLIAAQPELVSKANQLCVEVSSNDYTKGIGYYNSKNLLLLEYLIQFQFYQLFKINGEDLTQGQGLELYKRLAYLKTLLSKLSPVEKKLDYQKNKLIKYSDVLSVKPEPRKVAVKDRGGDSDGAEGDQIREEDEDDSIGGDSEEGEGQGQGQGQGEKTESDEDALAYQPRPQALLKVKQHRQTEAEKQGKYVAPKLSAALSKDDKKKRRQEIQVERKKAHLIQRYRDDLEDDDEAREQGVGSKLAQRIKEKFREKTAIEEQNFTRIPDSKQEKYWKKSMIRESERSNPLMDQLKDIEMIREIFTQRKQEESQPPRAPKRGPQASSSKPRAGTKKVKRGK